MSFTTVLNVSISASWLILAVIALRFALKKAPKAFHCALWALVAVRLLCPVSIESAMSLIPSREVVPQDYLYVQGEQRQEQAVLEVVENPSFPEQVEVPLRATVDRVQWWDLWGTLIWMAGMGVMGIYAVFSYLSLRLRVRFAAGAGEGVWVCDDIPSPFILGIFRPRIYLPSNLEAEQAAYVIAHEKAHLKRLDHLWKPLGFVLLSIHWFNPLMWAAYILLCRDIELACDERVIRGLDKDGIRRYSEALIACAIPRSMIAACPLAFGEVGVKQRIRSMLSYKKPGFWVLVLAAAVGVVLAACFLTDPISEPQREIAAITEGEGYTITRNTETTVHIMWYKDWMPAEIYTDEGYDFAEDELVLWESDTSRIYLDWAGLHEQGQILMFTLNMSYDLPKSGTIMVPYEISELGYDFSTYLVPESIHDCDTDYPEGIKIRGNGPSERFSIYANLEVYESLDEYLAMEVAGLYEITYVSSNMDITPLMGKTLSVQEVLYTHPDRTADSLSTYSLGADLALNVQRDSDLWQIDYTLGTLEPLELTWEQFDGLFLPEYWTGDAIAAKLRRENKSAWSCATSFTDPAVRHVLLHQKNGDVYLLVQDGQGQTITQLFRMEVQEPQDPNKTQSCRLYEFHPEGAFDTPFFRLYSDGTFFLSESVASSYLGVGTYTLKDGELVLRTDDGLYTWYFTADGEDFRFDAARSDVLHYAPTAKDWVALEDGAVFASSRGAYQNYDYGEMEFADLAFGSSVTSAGTILVPEDGDSVGFGVYWSDPEIVLKVGVVDENGKRYFLRARNRFDSEDGAMYFGSVTELPQGVYTIFVENTGTYLEEEKTLSAGRVAYAVNGMVA